MPYRRHLGLPVRMVAAVPAEMAGPISIPLDLPVAAAAMARMVAGLAAGLAGRTVLGRAGVMGCRGAQAVRQMAARSQVGLWVGRFPLRAVMESAGRNGTRPTELAVVEGLGIRPLGMAVPMVASVPGAT